MTHLEPLRFKARVTEVTLIVFSIMPKGARNRVNPRAARPLMSVKFGQPGIAARYAFAQLLVALWC